MKTQLNMENPVPPLDEIRQAEAKVASQILLARQEVEERKHAAQQQAKQIIEQARLSGEEAGRGKRQAQLQETARKAERIITAGGEQAEKIERTGNSQFEQSVSWAVSVVLGLAQKEDVP